MPEQYEAIIVGSGFASQLFLRRLLERNAVRKVLVLERGGDNAWEWQVKNQKNAPDADHYANHVELTGMAGKTWPHTIGVGGSSNCWWANPMRIHPNDFKLKTSYGVGVDWPVSYDELEPYYVQFEQIMHVSGDNDSARIFPRSAPFPQPRHRFSRVARKFKDRYPDLYFGMPQARARQAWGNFNPCCSNSVCDLCPAGAKYKLVQDMDWLRKDPRVEIRTGTEVKHVIAAGGRVTGVSCVGPQGAYEVSGDLVVLAANGIYNPFLLLKSGITDGRWARA